MSQLAESRQALAQQFQDFALTEADQSSPLYHALALSIARDDALLEIAEQVPQGQPAPELLLGAVHYLLGPEGSHRLAHFYSTRTTSTGQPSAAFPHFKDFVLQNRDSILTVLNSRRTQTHDPRRSAYLFAGLTFAASLFEVQRPLALVEIGPSAGLNLLWDKYQYSYGDSILYGDQDAPVLVTSEFRGFRKPITLSNPPPKISHRIGVDLQLLDTQDPDDTGWIRALVWPEHFERRILLDAALKHHRPDRLDIREGDGFAEIATIVKEVPDDSLLCVYHTHVAEQNSAEAYQEFADTLARVAKDRDLVHLYKGERPHVQLAAYQDGKTLIDGPIAYADRFAVWIDWQLDRQPIGKTAEASR